MQKKITYLTTNYMPNIEAISQEIDVLSEMVRKKDYNYCLFTKKTYDVFPSLFYIPQKLTMWIRLTRDSLNTNGIYHVFATGKMHFFNNIIPRHRTILTLISTGNLSIPRDILASYYCIVVETEIDRKRLFEYNVPKDKIRVINPISRANTPFKINSLKKGMPMRLLHASVPFFKKDLGFRGIQLIFKIAKESDDKVTIILACRTQKIYVELCRQINMRGLNNIKAVWPVANIKKLYKECHAVVVPYLKPFKSFPNSAIDSIGFGRPVLLSNRVYAASQLSDKGLAVIFEPDVSNFSQAIDFLYSNYNNYSKRCHSESKTINKNDVFLSSYMDIYEALFSA